MLGKLQTVILKSEFQNLIFPILIIISLWSALHAGAESQDAEDDFEDWATSMANEYHPILSAHYDKRPHEELNRLIKENDQSMIPIYEESIDETNESTTDDLKKQDGQVDPSATTEHSLKGQELFHDVSPESAAPIQLSTSFPPVEETQESQGANVTNVLVEVSSQADQDLLIPDIQIIDKTKTSKTEHHISSDNPIESSATSEIDPIDLTSASEIKPISSLGISNTTKMHVDESTLAQEPIGISEHVILAELSTPKTHETSASYVQSGSSKATQTESTVRSEPSVIVEKHVVDADTLQKRPNHETYDDPITVDISRDQKISTLQTDQQTPAATLENTQKISTSTEFSEDVMVAPVALEDQTPSTAAMSDNSDERSRLSATTFLVLTMFGTTFIGTWIFLKSFLQSISQPKIGKPPEIPTELEGEVEGMRHSLGDLRKRLGLDKDTDLKSHQKHLDAINLRLTKRLEQQKKLAPIKHSLNCLRDKLGGDVQLRISNRRSYLQTLRALRAVSERNSELKRKIQLSRYDQLVMIRNFVALGDLLDLMRDIEFNEVRKSLQDSSFEMSVETNFLSEQVDTFRKLTGHFVSEYEHLSNQILDEQRRQTKNEGEFAELRKNYKELVSSDPIDHLKRRIAEKELETDRYYKDYINNYYSFCLNQVEVT